MLIWLPDTLHTIRIKYINDESSCSFFVRVKAVMFMLTNQHKVQLVDLNYFLTNKIKIAVSHHS